MRTKQFARTEAVLMRGAITRRRRAASSLAGDEGGFDHRYPRFRIECNADRRAI